MDKFTQSKLHEIIESVKEDYLLKFDGFIGKYKGTFITDDVNLIFNDYKQLEYLYEY